MDTNAQSTARVRRLRERRSRGVAMVAPVEVGEGGINILIRNELLKQHQTRDRKAVGAACLAALEQWAEGRGAVSRHGGLTHTVPRTSPKSNLGSRTMAQSLGHRWTHVQSLMRADVIVLFQPDFDDDLSLFD